MKSDTTNPGRQMDEELQIMRDTISSYERRYGDLWSLCHKDRIKVETLTSMVYSTKAGLLVAFIVAFLWPIFIFLLFLKVGSN